MTIAKTRERHTLFVGVFVVGTPSFFFCRESLQLLPIQRTKVNASFSEHLQSSRHGKCPPQHLEVLSDKSAKRIMRKSTALLLSSKVAYSWVMPSRPMERWPAGILRLTRMEEDLEFFGGSRAFPVSREFESLCQTQMELLDDLLALNSATLFFRWENSDTGALEFRPVYVYPGGSVSSDGCGGSLRADTLIPGYPFVSYSDSEEGDWAVGAAGLPGAGARARTSPASTRASCSAP